jgi:siroheme synthase (precorrin-2 oxidase/ferrochelatase)
VVGGGKIAARKAQLLFDADARVTVVSPSLNDVLTEQLAEGKIKHIARPFEPTDVDAKFVTFAATNIKPVNRQVLAACQERNGLCCCVDGDWINSDFVTPAILREKEFILSVSTGGGSCRRSRRLKENLRNHIQFLNNADLLVLGIDHHCASIDELEASKQRINQQCDLFSCLWGVHEFMILSTCNRLEFIGIVSDHHKTIQLLQHMLGLRGNFYLKKGVAAFTHLAEIAAGLHAQTLGEKNIVAQLKLAFTDASTNEWASSGVQSWLDTALRISKEIRQEMEPFIENMEIEDVCDLYLKEHHPDAEHVLILGRGVIGSGILQRRPYSDQISGRDDAEIRAKLPSADIIIGTTGSTEFVVTKEHQSLLKNGAVLIDLSMPRNIDPDLPGVLGLADLKHWCRPDNLAHIMELSRPIIEKHMHEYERLVDA